MELDLTDDETAALERLLSDAIDRDRYPLSPRIKMMKGVTMKQLDAVVAGVAFGVTLFAAIACAQAQGIITGQITSLRAHSGNANAGDSSRNCMVFQIGGSDTIGPGTQTTGPTGKYAIDRSDPGYTDEKEALEIAFAGAAGNQVQLQFYDSGTTDPNCGGTEYVTFVVVNRVLP